MSLALEKYKRDERVFRAHKAGVLGGRIARALKLTRKTVYDILRSKGVAHPIRKRCVKPKPHDPELLKALRKARKQGATVRELGREFGLPPTSVFHLVGKGTRVKRFKKINPWGK